MSRQPVSGRLRVASVGAGYFSRFHLEGWRAISGVEHVALCDSDGAKARALAQRFGIPETHTDAAQMLDAARPDIFDIVTPPPTHHALVAAAAERGIFAVCQKPLAPDYAQALAVVETAERAGSELVVHENFRFMPWFREAKGLIGNGTLGEMWLEGSNGVLRLDGDARLYWKPHRGPEAEHSYERGPDTGFGGGACEALQRHVVRHLREGGSLENRARDYLVNLEVQEAEYRSHDTGRRVELAGFDPVRGKAPAR
jgi:predicted dehydrogenase